MMKGILTRCLEDLEKEEHWAEDKDLEETQISKGQDWLSFLIWYVI